MRILFFLIFIVRCSFGQTPSNDGHWQLLWQDDFDSLNTDIWDVKNNFDHCSPDYLREIQVYTDRPANVSTSNGSLVIRAAQETYSCPPSAVNQWGCYRQYSTNQPYNYTSGCVVTKNTYFIHYGYIEARIKVPYGNGFFPAFWTWTGIPSYQEIDVFEMTPADTEYCERTPIEKFLHTKNIATSNIHLGNGEEYCHYWHKIFHINDYTQWHTYAIEWSPSRIIWYMDDYPIRYYPNFQITAPTSIILNFAIQRPGGSYPAEMQIDFVKVYQLNKNCEEFINTCNYNFSAYDNFQKDFIIIGTDGGNNSLVSDQDVKLRASEYILLDGDFTVPLGASFYADANGECPEDAQNLACTKTFNPCSFNFTKYDNLLKRIIELGGNGCSMSIIPGLNNILLHATDNITLHGDVTLIPSQGKNVELKVVACE